MHSQLRERIRLMRARLDNAAPVAEIRAESQLFVSPAPICDRLVTLAEISNRDHILEPSAGTGAILRAIRDTAPEAMCDAVEINSGLVRYLRENFNGVRVQCGDFQTKFHIACGGFRQNVIHVLMQRFIIQTIEMAV